jgi:hypothetical protein
VLRGRWSLMDNVLWHSVNGGAKAGHCGGVKVGQSQCEWSR